MCDKQLDVTHNPTVMANLYHEIAKAIESTIEECSEHMHDQCAWSGDLVPCPFCKAEYEEGMSDLGPKSRPYDGADAGLIYFVHCECCDARGPDSIRSVAEACDRWNHRPLPNE